MRNGMKKGCWGGENQAKLESHQLEFILGDAKSASITITQNV